MRPFVPLLALLLVLPAFSTQAVLAPQPVPVEDVPSLPRADPGSPAAPIVLTTAPGFGNPEAMPPGTSNPIFVTGQGRGEPGIKIDRVHEDIWVHSFESSWASLNGGPFEFNSPFVPLSGDGEIALGYPGGEFPHRVYKMDLTIACESLAWKDLDQVDPDPTGLAWLRDDAACGIPIQDRQWLATGPNVLPNGALAPPILPGTTHQEALYLAVNQLATGLQVAKAVPITTGGVPHFTQVMVLPGGCFRGNIAVDQTDGTVYVADCDGVGAGSQQVFVSKTGGVSWEPGHVIAGSGPSVLFPVVTVDNAGNVYMVWTEAASHDVKFSYSTNKGTTWSTPVKVNNPTGGGPEGTVFPWIVAGDDGRVDIVYLGTQRDIAPDGACPNISGGTCNNVPSGVVDLWYLYMAQSQNAHDATPTFTEVKAVADPVQRGNICTSGTGCPGGVTGGAPRHLADFIQVDYDWNGNAVIAYADACPSPCASTGPISTEAVTHVVRQTSGDPIAGTIPDPPVPEVLITVPTDGATWSPSPLVVNGTVDRDSATATPALVADAGGPYSGGEGTSIAISGSATGGVAPYSCSWSGSGATFGSASACATTVSFATAGSHTITLQVTDAASTVDTDTAAVTALAPSTDRVLWLVGDGSVNVGGIGAASGEKTNFALSSTGNGNLLTTATTIGPSDLDDPANPLGPTFLGGPVTLYGSPVTLKVHVTYREPLNAAGDVCPVGAQLLTASGIPLGPAGGVEAFPPFSTGPTEVSFTIVPDLSAVGGAPYTGDIIVNVGTIFVDCGAAPTTWTWGTSAFNGRLILGTYDQGGGSGPLASVRTPALPAESPFGLSMFDGLAAEPPADGPLLGIWGEVGDVTLDNDADSLEVRMNLPGLLDGAVPTEFGTPFTYQVSFVTDHNFAGGLEYRATYTYDIVSLETLALLADTFALQVNTAPNAAGVSTLCPVATDLSESFFDTTTFDIVWVIPLSAFNHDNQAAQGNCAGFTTGGDALAAGDTLTDIIGEAAVKLVVVTIGGLGDTTDPGTYTLVGGPTPLVADAGGDYSGLNGASISITGTATGGTAPYSCSWSGTGATFASATSCSTTVSYSSSGAHTITLTVTDATSVTDADTATVTTGDPERVEVTLADRSATAAVDTSVSDTDTWSVTLDLTGLADGTYDLTATWKESDGTVIDTDVIQVTVDDPNSAPSLSVPGPQSGSEGQALGFSVSAADPDGDTVTLSASDLPAGATFDGSTGAFQWTPSYSQSGSYRVTFLADDGQGGTDRESVDLAVAHVNQAPVLQGIGDVTVTARTLLQFTVLATDVDGDTVTYSADNLPSGATLNPVTGEFAWVPAKNQAGVHTIVFHASDGALEDSQSANITVTRN